MASINFFRTNALPSPPEPSSLYFVKDTVDSDKAKLFIVGTDNTDIRQLDVGGSQGYDPVINVVDPATSTSILSNSYVATASSQYLTNSPDKAFDNDPADGWGTANGDQLGWIIYDVGAGNGFIPHQYSLYRDSNQPGGWTDNQYSPKDWTISVREDGGTWVDVDVRTNEMIVADDPATVYTLTNPSNTSYRYFRLKIDDNQGFTYSNITLIDIFNVTGTGGTVDKLVTWKEINSALSTNSGGSVSVPHGLSKEDIIEARVKVNDTSTDLMDEFTGTSKRRVSVKWDDVNVIIKNKNADNLLGKNCSILIMHLGEQPSSSLLGVTIAPQQDW